MLATIEIEVHRGWEGALTLFTACQQMWDDTEPTLRPSSSQPNFQYISRSNQAPSSSHLSENLKHKKKMYIIYFFPTIFKKRMQLH